MTTRSRCRAVLRESSCRFFPRTPCREQLRDRGKQVAEVGDLSVRVQACESCHGPNGEGDLISGVPYLGGQYSHYITCRFKCFAKVIGRASRCSFPLITSTNKTSSRSQTYFEQHLVQQKVNHRRKRAGRRISHVSEQTRERGNPAPLALRPMKLSKMVPAEPWSSQLARGFCSSQLGCCSFCVVHEQGARWLTSSITKAPRV